MKKLPPVLLVVIGLCATTLAQDAASEARPKAAPEKRSYVPTATPSTTAEQESPGLLQRLFGSRQGRRVLFPPTPTPTPQATPAPKTSAKTGAKAQPKKRKPKPAADAPESAPAPAKPKSPDAPTPDAPKPDAPTPDAPKPDAPDQSATPAPAPVVPDAPPPAAVVPAKSAPATSASAKKTRKGKAAPVAAAPAGVLSPEGDPEAKEKFRFEQAKVKASEDPEVMELKAKADNAVTDEDARTAQRAYNKALFSQMRKIDATLEEHINAMEAAILKRLDEK